MLRDVRSNVTDGLLGFATATGDGLHIKIGVSPSVTEKPITCLLYTSPSPRDCS